MDMDKNKLSLQWATTLKPSVWYCNVPSHATNTALTCQGQDREPQGFPVADYLGSIHWHLSFGFCLGLVELGVHALLRCISQILKWFGNGEFGHQGNGLGQTIPDGYLWCGREYYEHPAGSLILLLDSSIVITGCMFFFDWYKTK